MYSVRLKIIAFRNQINLSNTKIKKLILSVSLKWPVGSKTRLETNFYQKNVKNSFYLFLTTGQLRNDEERE